ncbi:O-methyltransferase [Christiangramia sabulilitoris]|uniref:Class I SAM-dependent methyltransferase n=1 Tax=Christiangramia sabulilitoris TaxID=2583991 RepID=A0A550HZF3_9FLAO|nr:class I SAM-dependent methyltransferase [Christiangramia sabulilitoris]TRO63938.1 class I SAM-dependent methyltransferase [Christiangramia sabulilitoris]
MLFQLKSYFNFLLKSQNQHGLHSPFVYDLVTKCFYNKNEHKAYKLIKDYRNNLLGNKNRISVTDFGAGSRVFRSNERPVFSIAKNAGITLHRAKLLYRLTNYLKVDTALELGTSLGIASSAIAAKKNTKLITIEGCPKTAKIAGQQFEKFDLNNIELRVNKFDAEMDALIQENQKFDLIYFDGNHQKQATLDYFNQLLPTAHNDSVFIFDDIHWSSEMEEAWEEIKKHPKVQVTIDTFQWGLVFFRKEQVKQHFNIRV